MDHSCSWMTSRADRNEGGNNSQISKRSKQNIEDARFSWNKDSPGHLDWLFGIGRHNGEDERIYQGM